MPIGNKPASNPAKRGAAMSETLLPLYTLRHFVLYRTEDISGTSGTGCVAQGVEFADGMCVLRWLTTPSSVAVYNSLADVRAIHGHDGRTEVRVLSIGQLAVKEARDV